MLKLLLIFSLQSYSFLDFLGDTAKDAAEGAAIASAMAELVDFLDVSDDLVQDFQAIEQFSKGVEKNLNETIYLSRESQNLLKGINYSSNRLSSNIRYTTSYLRRLKSLFVRFSMFGSSMATALNTLETNVALGEVQKNQQTMIMMQRQRDLIDMNEKLHEERTWNDFLENEREIRYGGKLE